MTKPTLTLPGSIPPPPPAPPPPLPFPTPWIVGPGGDIWVAADVERTETGWTHTVQAPRIVVWRNEWPDGLAQMIVDAVNARYGV